MKKLHTLVYPAVALVAIVSAASAFAQVAGSTTNPYDEAYSQQSEAPGVLTRAQVRAELQQSRARHDNRVYANGYSQQNDAVSTRSRAEVRAQAIAAMRSGLAQALVSEDSGSFYMSQHPSPTLAGGSAGPLLADAQR
ncbi:MAG: DUF4148 domain-containing protein [Burkholderiales bacterium]|nr:DUF4148 domain-containing protein [Burkholderiales bacterium]